MKDLRDGETPNAGASLASERPLERALKAAEDGAKQGHGKPVNHQPSPDAKASERPAAGAPISTEGGQEPSGRRRRRRRKSARKAGIANQSGDAAAAATPSEKPKHPDKQAHGDKKGRRRRRKSGREIQGRPLTPQKAVKPVESRSDPSVGVPHAAAHAGPARAPRRQSDDLYAALDLGTNNCRLLIAQPTRPGQFRVVDAFSRIVRLGEGLDATGQLSRDAMDRAVEALKVCAGKLKNRPVRRHRLIATEACRSARNGVEFLDRVRNETGLELEIVTRETEARLAVAGCSSLVDRDTDGLVLFDIGGGSSEIAMIDLTENRSNRLANHIKAWTSLPVGVVTLSERHGGCLVTPEVFQAMVEEVDAMLAAFIPPPLPAFDGRGEARIHLLGTSGTVTTLAGLHLELPRYDRRKVDGLWLSNTDVDLMLERLLSWDFEARASNPCIGADRADLVLAGCAILQSIRKRWPSPRMRVADRGLREGLLNEMMASDGAWRRSARNYRNRNQRPGHGGKP